jgi:hypothetical protein
VPERAERRPTGAQPGRRPAPVLDHDVRGRRGPRRTGIYIVALSEDADTLDATVGSCPLSSVAVRELLNVRHAELRLDHSGAGAVGTMCNAITTLVITARS